MAKKAGGDDVQSEFYIPFVQSLFANGSTLIFGIVAQALTAVLCYFSSGDVIYIYICAALLVTGVIRGTITRVRTY